METVVSKKASIALLAEHVKIQKNRIEIVEPENDWRLIILVIPDSGYLRIACGNGDLDGWTESIDPVTHMVSGVDISYLALFAKFVCDNYVGDERINDCVAYLLSEG